MRFDDNDRKTLSVTATTSVDSSSATAKLAIDGIECGVTWDTTATAAGGKWTRKGHTDVYFAGPAVTNPDGATVLALGAHTAELRVTIGPTTLAQPLLSFWVA